MTRPPTDTAQRQSVAPPTSRVTDAPRPAAKPFDAHRVRSDFPILSTKVHGKPLVYLDNGATTQKPQAVIDAIQRYYAAQNANIHRGVYELSQRATELYENARITVQKFLNAPSPEEIIFTRGTTESINLVAQSFARAFLKSGDEIIISTLEHHSNIVPWQIACELTGAKLRVIPINDTGELDLSQYIKLLSPKTKIVAVNHVSNSLGTINPVKEMILLAHRAGAKVLIDGAQWVAHHPTDVQAIDADFYAFSGHKLFGPTGIGVLFGKRELLTAMPPFMGGGDMIKSVSFEKTVYADLPNKFEAGTPNIEGAIGLAAAIDYLQSIAFKNFEPYESDLLAYATEKLAAIPGLRIIGTAKNKASVISFVMESPPISSLDLGLALDREGIALRTGHHCCQPVMDRFHIPSTTRLSLALYNTRQDVDAAAQALLKIRQTTLEKSAIPTAPSPNADHTLLDEPIHWPAPSAPSVAAAAAAIADLFEELGDAEARTEYLTELGEKIPPMPASLKTEQTRVHGCMSTVHLFGQKDAAQPQSLDFLADSDAHIVRGLIGLLEKLFAGQPASEILSFDIEAFFNQIGLERFITVQRRNGLAGMVQRIKALATQIAEGNHV